MKINIVYLLLIALLGITVSASVAQQNQNVPKTDTEVEKLKIQLQTVENEKMELAAKLINSEFGKFERELRNSNDKWLWGWTAFFAAIVVIVVTVIGVAFWVVVKSMIADRVEERLNEFKEAIEQVNILKKELEVLKKELAVSVLDNFDPGWPVELEWHNEAIKALSEEILLEIFSDKTRNLRIRWAAADVLVTRKSPRLVSPVLTSLNSIVDSDIDRDIFPARFSDLHIFWDWPSGIYNKEIYQGLKDFLNRLIKEDPKNKDLFLPWTVFLLAQVSLELDLRDSIDILREVIPDLIELKPEEVVLTTLTEYFDKFKEHEGIKKILTNGLTDNMPDVETRCLELLEKHDPDFVNEWKAQKEDTNTEREETDESKPTT